MYFILQVPYSKQSAQDARKLQQKIKEENKNVNNLIFFNQDRMPDRLSSKFFKKKTSVYHEYEVYRDNDNLISVEINHADISFKDCKVITVSYTGDRAALHSNEVFKNILNWLTDCKDTLIMHEYSYTKTTPLEWWQKEAT